MHGRTKRPYKQARDRVVLVVGGEKWSRTLGLRCAGRWGLYGCTVVRLASEHKYDMHACYGQCLVYYNINHGKAVAVVRHIYKHMVRCMGRWLSVIVHSWKCVVVCMCMRLRVRMLTQHTMTYSTHGTYDVCVHGYVGVAESRTCTGIHAHTYRYLQSGIHESIHAQSGTHTQE